MIDNNYKVTIDGQDFSDIIAMENGYQYTISSFSAESATGQDTLGYVHVPILGELVQLAFRCPEYITKDRLKQLVVALKMGSKGQREISIKYHDALFGEITTNFYCTNIPWIKYKIPRLGNYVKDVTFQLASTGFVNHTVLNDTPKIAPIFNNDANFKFKLNGKEFNDIIDIDGFKGQLIEQSLESTTGRTLDGKMHLPIIGSRSQMETGCIEYIEIGRFRQLGKELGFGIKGERSHKINYYDEIMGEVDVNYYCTQISGFIQKLPNYPYHYIKDVKFQQAMKQFF